MPLSQFQPAQYDSLLTEKVTAVRQLLAPFEPPEAEVFASASSGFRMRAEFRMWHDGDDLNYVMFRPGDPKTPIAIDHFPIACERIQTLMPVLRERLKNSPLLRQKLFQVEFLSTLAGDTLITLIYHRKLLDDWNIEAAALATELDVAIVGRSRKQKVILSRDYVTETLPVAGCEYHYRQYEQAFTQPNARMNIRMLEWALDCAGDNTDDLLELYCGNGNFTLPLAQRFKHVIATELAKTSIKAAQWNIERNDVNNVEMIRLSAEEVTQAMNGEREFRRLALLPKPLSDYQLNTVFVDPPRAGLDPATEAMVSGFARILYISCNPNTLAGNLEMLSKTHHITRLAMFDQFPYTQHMECGVLLEQR